MVMKTTLPLRVGEHPVIVLTSCESRQNIFSI